MPKPASFTDCSHSFHSERFNYLIVIEGKDLLLSAGKTKNKSQAKGINVVLFFLHELIHKISTCKTTGRFKARHLYILKVKDGEGEKTMDLEFEPNCGAHFTEAAPGRHQMTGLDINQCC